MSVASPMAPRAVRRCRVCGCSEIRTDEVVEDGIVLLAECPRCGHRFTQRVASAPARPLHARAPVVREIAPAA
jgi:uncharacterized Zn finger protein